MVDSKKSRSAATHLPSKALVRIIRAADRRARSEASPVKPERTAVPVEVLAGRVRHAPRGRFVTGGRVELAGQQEKSDPQERAPASEREDGAAQGRKGSVPRPLGAERHTGFGRERHAQKKSGVGACVRRPRPSVAQADAGLAGKRDRKKPPRPHPASEGPSRSRSAGGGTTAPQRSSERPRASTKSAAPDGRRPRGRGSNRAKIPAQGLKTKRK